MKASLLISSLLLVASTAVADSINSEPDDFSSHATTINIEDASLPAILHNPDAKPLAIDDIKVMELEEEVQLNFDTKKYLPENFNPLKGMYDLDWDKIELLEPEEEVTFDFDVKDYLPADFNPYKRVVKYKLCSK